MTDIPKKASRRALALFQIEQKFTRNPYPRLFDVARTVSTYPKQYLDDWCREDSDGIREEINILLRAHGSAARLDEFSLASPLELLAIYS